MSEWKGADSLFDDEAAAFANVKRERPNEPRTKAQTQTIIKEATTAAKRLTKSLRPEPPKAGSKVGRRPLRYSAPRQMEIPEEES